MLPMDCPLDGFIVSEHVYSDGKPHYFYGALAIIFLALLVIWVSASLKSLNQNLYSEAYRSRYIQLTSLRRQNEDDNEPLPPYEGPKDLEEGGGGDVPPEVIFAIDGDVDSDLEDDRPHYEDAQRQDDVVVAEEEEQPLNRPQRLAIFVVAMNLDTDSEEEYEEEELYRVYNREWEGWRTEITPFAPTLTKRGSVQYDDTQSDIYDLEIKPRTTVLDHEGSSDRLIDGTQLQAAVQQTKPTPNYAILRTGRGLPYMFCSNPAYTAHFECANSISLGPELAMKIVNRGEETRDPETPPSEDIQYLLSNNGTLLCIDSAYGYIARGTDTGQLEVLCTVGEPHWIIVHRFGILSMVNSVQIIRRLDDDDDRSKDEVYLVVSLNSSAVTIIPLQRHSEHRGPTVPLVTRQKVVPKDRIPINDSKISPCGRFLASVGDHGSIWCAPILQKSSTTSDAADDLEDEDVDVDIETFEDGDEGDEWMDVDDEGGEESQGFEPGSLDDASWRVGDMKRIDIKKDVPGDLRRFSSQYVSWAADSSVFACSSNSHAFVLICDPRRQCVVLKIDCAAPTFAVAFHPSRPNILAVILQHLVLYVFDIEPALANQGPVSTQIVPISYRSHKSEVDESGEIRREDTDRVCEKLTGLVWACDGSALYVGTRWATLYYPCVEVPSLKDLRLKRIIEGDLVDQLSKDKTDEGVDLITQIQESFRNELDKECVKVNTWYLDHQHQAETSLKLLTEAWDDEMPKSDQEGWMEDMAKLISELENLNEFVNTNLEGFKKILKKFDKHMKRSDTMVFWPTVGTYGFAKSEMDELLLSQAQQQWRKHIPTMPLEPTDTLVIVESDVPTTPVLDLDVLPAGKVSYLWITLGEDGLGQPHKVPVIVAKGMKAGPVVGMTAALHGNELNGIPIIHRLFREINVKQLCGTVVAVVVANTPGFLRGQRHFSEGTDLNRVMPGKKNGSSPQVYAFNLMEKVISKFEWLIDLHTASKGRVNSLYCRANMLDTKTRKMASLQNPQIIVHNTSPDGSLRGAAMDLGIAAITVEIGDPSRFQKRFVKNALLGVSNILAHLQMIPLEPDLPEYHPVVCSKSYWIFADRGGILTVLPEITTWVKKGEPIAHIHSLFGALIHTYCASEDGIIVGKSVDPVCESGSRILHLGVVEGNFASVVHDGHL
ncbi:hypothetical protein SmJEL517_g02395 [Synchytrium microbalum]|uniref:Succinylglutamate desuccinylase/Aspartoacylase catalytic domain-containing protein n=1 Tax=Synchytrium microbalum TaxID=1806994 RepID=A0A507CBV6_9FUNG|nr:uncharacterized protein SmJEL517_g02395 [Synchytrium microbalum]TPX35045.1 hypothetical protein SmJEL517_g02395 [Synchytrium microbalum]